MKEQNPAMRSCRPSLSVSKVTARQKTHISHFQGWRRVLSYSQLEWPSDTHTHVHTLHFIILLLYSHKLHSLAESEKALHYLHNVAMRGWLSSEASRTGHSRLQINSPSDRENSSVLWGNARQQTPGCITPAMFGILSRYLFRTGRSEI